MMNRAEFRNGVLGRLGSYQVGAFRAFGAWELAESGTEVCNGVSPDGARWNPYNTTQKMPGSTLYGTNTAGVQNYVTYLDGVNATVKTLNNGFYQAILDAIHTDNISAKQVCEAIGSTPWGTSTSGLLAALSAYQGDRMYYNGLPIGV